MALLGEMPYIQGTADMCGSVFYASQEAWIFSATIKQNIIFGKAYDKKKFRDIIETCSLEKVGENPNTKFNHVGLFDLITYDVKRTWTVYHMVKIR